MILTGEDPSTGRKNVSQCVTKILTWTGLEPNPGLSGDRPGIISVNMSPHYKDSVHTSPQNTAHFHYKDRLNECRIRK